MMPSIISPERAKDLLKKWGPILEYDALSDEEYKAKYGKDKVTLKTAILLEGQESYKKIDWNKTLTDKDI